MESFLVGKAALNKADVPIRHLPILCSPWLNSGEGGVEFSYLGQSTTKTSL